jgi:hypothetical protein
LEIKKVNFTNLLQQIIIIFSYIGQ